VEKLWSLAGRFPYRCSNCQTRFFVTQEPHRENAHASKTGEDPVRRSNDDED